MKERQLAVRATIGNYVYLWYMYLYYIYTVLTLYLTINDTIPIYLFI